MHSLRLCLALLLFLTGPLALANGNWVDASPGATHTIALKSDGTVWYAGSGTYGNYSVFTQVAAGAIDVAASGASSYILKTDGTVWKDSASGAWTQVMSGMASLVETKGGVFGRSASAGLTLSDTSISLSLGIQSSGHVSSSISSLNDALAGITEVAIGDPNQVCASNGYYSGCISNSETLLALQGTGALWAAGSNSSGTWGNGATSNTAATTWTPVLSGVRHVSLTNKTSFAIKWDGTLWATGINSTVSGAGIFGDGTTANTTTWKQVATGVSLAIPGDHAVMVKTDGTLWATGANSKGELGLGTTTNTTAWTQVGVIDSLTASKGTYSDRIKVAWSNSGDTSATTFQIYRSVGLNGAKSPLATVSGTTSYDDTTASAGVVYGYCVAVSGSTCQAASDYGYILPSPSAALSGTGNYVKAASGASHSLALRKDGSLVATGANNNGQLGDGTNNNTSIYKRVLNGVKDIAAYGNTSFALKTDGSLWATGLNNGLFGDGATANSNTWKQVLSGVASITVKNAPLAVKTDGSLWTIVSNTWTQDTQIAGVKKAFAGITVNSALLSRAALKTDGSLWVNQSNGSWSQIAADIADFAINPYFACSIYGGCTVVNLILAVKTDHTLWAYGASYGNEPGIGARTTDATAWIKVFDNVSSVSIAGYGAATAFALRTDGSMWATGAYNNLGASALASWSRVLDQVSVLPATANTGDNALAVRSNGTLWGIGNNTLGQLGIYPVSLTTITKWTETGFVLPGQITGLTASQAGYYNKVALSWNPDMDADAYDIYRSTASGTKGAYLATVNAPAAAFDDTTASGTDHYFYTVAGKNKVGPGPDSTQAEGWLKPVAAISDLSASKGTIYGKIHLAWTANPDATGYDVYRTDTATGAPQKIKTIPATGGSPSSYDDPTTDGTHYFYTVVASVGTSASAVSNQAEGWGKMPATIYDLAATQGTVTGLARLSWTANPDATGYDIYRAASPSATPAYLATVNSASYEDSLPDAAMRYYTVAVSVGTLHGQAGNQAAGYANLPPASASAALSATAVSPSSPTAPTVQDPNVAAGETESFTLSITAQPPSGTVSISGNAFVYTPPADGSYAGTETFTFTATDKGGASIAGTGNITVACGQPVIASVNVPASGVLVDTALSVPVAYSVPACANNATLQVDVLDGNTPVVVGTATHVGNGVNQTYAASLPPMDTAKAYTVRATLTTDAGQTVQSANLTVSAVSLPTLKIMPGLSVTPGMDTVSVSIVPPSKANCPLADVSTALLDPSRCFVAFSAIPTGLAVDNSGALPQLQGVITDGGAFPVTLDVFKYDAPAGTARPVGLVTQSITATCQAPSISAFSLPIGLLPFSEGTMNATYTAYGCNGALSGSLSLSQNGNTVATVPLQTLSNGASQSAAAAVGNLPSGGYDATLSITGSSGTGTKTGKLTIISVPAPMLNASSWTPIQNEEKVTVGVAQPAANPCPLTGSDADAQADHGKCLVSFDTLPQGLTPGTDANGLPTAQGYIATAGKQPISASIYHYGVDNQSHRVATAANAFSVQAFTQPTFGVTGATTLYQGDPLALALKQATGSFCVIYTDSASAASAAAGGARVCLATLTLPDGATQTLTNGRDAIKIGGTLANPGSYPVSYEVSRIRADGSQESIASSQLTVTVNALPPPQMVLSNGVLIGDSRYYVQNGRPLAKATVQAPSGVPSQARMTLALSDGTGTLTLPNLANGSSLWLPISHLALFEERKVDIKLAYSTAPNIASDTSVTAVGGIASGVRAFISAPTKVSDTDTVPLTLKIGAYGSKGMAYDPATMGQWRAYVTAQNDSGQEKPITEMVDVIDGQASFNLNPAGYTLMKLRAYATLASQDPSITQSIASNSWFIQVVKGSPIVGTLTSKPTQAPVKTPFTVALSMSRDNIVALGGIDWEESSDNGATWTTAKKNAPPRYNTMLDHPGQVMVRAHLVNRNSGVESWTDPVTLTAYPALAIDIKGPTYSAPNIPVSLAANISYGGQAIPDAVVEWTTVQSSGKQSMTGSAVQVQDAAVGAIHVTMRARLPSTDPKDANAWNYATRTVTIANPSPPRIGIDGPTVVEVGRTYHYTGSVKPGWGGQESPLTLASEWVLPDGTVKPGTDIDWTPTPDDMTTKTPLLFRAWVEGFKDKTTAAAKRAYSPWLYQWPAWQLSAGQDADRAPANISLRITHDHPEMAPHFEGLKFDWSFPPGVDGRQNGSDPSRASAVAQVSGDNPISVTISDARGNTTTLGQTFTLKEPEPYQLALASYVSNRWKRAPADVVARPTITGGHPKDRIVSRSWLLDGQRVSALDNYSYGSFHIDQPGDHTIELDAASLMGKTITGTINLTLTEDIPPTCDFTANKSTTGTVVKAACTDSDGRIVGYTWSIDGQSLPSSVDHILLTPGASPKTSRVTLTATDDAGKISQPVTKSVGY